MSHLTYITGRIPPSRTFDEGGVCYPCRNSDKSVGIPTKVIVIWRSVTALDSGLGSGHDSALGSTPGLTPRSTPHSPYCRARLHARLRGRASLRARLRASTPGLTPGSTPRLNPHSTPALTPGSTLRFTPGSTLSSTPGSTPCSTPHSTPGSTPRSTLLSKRCLHRAVHSTCSAAASNVRTSPTQQRRTQNRVHVQERFHLHAKGGGLGAANPFGA